MTSSHLPSRSDFRGQRKIDLAGRPDTHKKPKVEDTKCQASPGSQSWGCSEEERALQAGDSQEEFSEAKGPGFGPR